MCDNREGRRSTLSEETMVSRGRTQSLIGGVLASLLHPKAHEGDEEADEATELYLFIYNKSVFVYIIG